MLTENAALPKLWWRQVSNHSALSFRQVRHEQQMSELSPPGVFQKTGEHYLAALLLRRLRYWWPAQLLPPLLEQRLQAAAVQILQRYSSLRKLSWHIERKLYCTELSCGKVSGHSADPCARQQHTAAAAV